MVSPDLGGGLQALVAKRRRHPDVYDGDVGRVGANLEQEILGVLTAADDVQAMELEQRGDSVAKERLILRDHHAQGRSIHGHGVCCNG